MKSRYSDPNFGRPRPQRGVRGGKLVAAVVIGIPAAGIITGVGAWSALVVVPVALVVWGVVKPGARRGALRR
ncbi:hypothetical protein [Micromonospora maritima]|uniref:hypothetical protein n=1 Tax=Micromonospora maritima TaxID=986711 RepID=UPI00157D609E|nr:hypothetical protein [Micromonospora maritima]